MCLKLVDLYLLESNVRVEFYQDFLVEKSGVLTLYWRPLQTEILCKDTAYWKKCEQHPLSCYIVFSLWLSRTIIMWSYVKLDLLYFRSAWVDTRALCLRWTCWWHLRHHPSQGWKNAAWSRAFRADWSLSVWHRVYLCIPTSSFECICITEDKGQHNRPISKYPTLRTRIELDRFALHV